MLDFVLPIQEAVRTFDLDLSRVNYHGYSDYVWGVVNLNGDSIAQLATTYNSTEVGVYKRILKHLSQSPKNQDSHLKLALIVKNFESSYTASKSEQLIQGFLDDFWLFKTYIETCSFFNIPSSDTGKIIVGPKAVLELKNYFLEEKLFEECSFCSALICAGESMECSKEDCTDTRVHRACAETFGQCSICKSPLKLVDD